MLKGVAGRSSFISIFIGWEDGNEAVQGVVEIIRYRFFFVILFLLPLVACSPFLSKRIPLSFDKPEECQAFLNRLDEMVEEAGVRDASSVSILGFPYLRTNRFLAALKKNLKGEAEMGEWVRWMQQLDLHSRKKEISNLPDKTILSPELKDGNKVDRQFLYTQVGSCSSKLMSDAQTRSDFYTMLLSLVDVPDEYSCFRRTIGLYPLIAIPVAIVTDRSRERIRKRFGSDLNDLPVDGHLKSFVPEGEAFLSEDEVQRIIGESKKNPLGVLLLDDYQEKKLVWSFAPVFIQDMAASYDRFGQVAWKGSRIEIDGEKPTVYYYISHAFMKGEPILQINYVIWYSERAGKRSPSIELGHLDGLTARVSLDPQGRVFMVDVVNECGCYHFFVPDRERIEEILSRPLIFDPFVPQWLPALKPGERPAIRINSGWHQVQRLISMGELHDPISYALVPYDVLEILPREDGQRESIFDSKGIVKGSKRLERFILFSMGIPSIGSMRQRGHQAIELIGEDHFDNPHLFDQNFVFK
jgi:hypothetical protein